MASPPSKLHLLVRSEIIKIVSQIISNFVAVRLERYEIDRCRLLKINCEGAEYEILHNTHVLDRVDYLSSEFHINQRLEQDGYSIESL